MYEGLSIDVQISGGGCEAKPSFSQLLPRLPQLVFPPLLQEPCS